MKFSLRLSGLRWIGLLGLIVWSSQLAWAQNSELHNPLRQRPTKPQATEPAKQVEPAVAEEPVLSSTESRPVLKAAESRVARARRRARRAVRPASYGLFGPKSGSTRLVQAEQPLESQHLAPELPTPEGPPAAEEIVVDGIPRELPGEIVLEEGWHEGWDEGLSDCCGGKGCRQCVTLNLPCISFENLEVFGGVQGFTGPKNRGGTGSFGLDIGTNWGAPLVCSGGSLGMQLGFRSSFSNLSGAEFTRDTRDQFFLTGGLFRRVDWGLQGGLVVDYLRDSWYTNTDLVQLRGELSWVYPHGHEFGIWFTSHTRDDTASSLISSSTTPLTETWESTDLFAFYYRKRICEATGRFFAGFSNDSDGLIGGDLRLPLGDSWALQSGFTYLIPEQARTGASGGGHEQESWNVGINLVWYPGCRTPGSYHRPLFNVADNGSFMVDRR